MEQINYTPLNFSKLIQGYINRANLAFVIGFLTCLAVLYWITPKIVEWMKTAP